MTQGQTDPLPVSKQQMESLLDQSARNWHFIRSFEEMQEMKPILYDPEVDTTIRLLIAGKGLHAIAKRAEQIFRESVISEIRECAEDNFLHFLKEYVQATPIEKAAVTKALWALAITVPDLVRAAAQDKELTTQGEYRCLCTEALRHAVFWAKQAGINRDSCDHILEMAERSLGTRRASD
jgi:hypothetical protein